MSDKITIVLQGHSQETAVREIVHLALKVGVVQSSEVPEKDYVLSRTEISHNEILVETTLSFKGKTGKNEYIHKQSPEKNPAQNLTNAVKMGFYLLYCRLFSATLPWGMQTGIRPAQLAAKHLKVCPDTDYAAKMLREEYGISTEKALLAAEVAQNEEKVLSEKKPEGISLYIGIPFCPTRCLYCSFVSLPLSKQKKNVEPYTLHLVKEIEYVGKMIKNSGTKVDSIYIGGGTPTSLDENCLRILLKGIKENIETEKLKEYTIEAGRADTITPGKLEIIREYTPHNLRLSINPQTLNNSVLKTIGRNHTAEEFFEAFSQARALGFTNINCDLIAGLPGESYKMFISSLNSLIRLNPENITLHTMCIKRAASLNETFVDTTDETAREMVTTAGKLLKDHGYFPYYMYRQKDTLGALENTGFSKTGHEGLYNILMMEDISTVIGLGAGAVSKLLDRETGRIDRVYNYKDPWEYINKFDEIIKRKRLK